MNPMDLKIATSTDGTALEADMALLSAPNTILGKVSMTDDAYRANPAYAVAIAAAAFSALPGEVQAEIPMLTINADA